MELKKFSVDELRARGYKKCHGPCKGIKPLSEFAKNAYNEKKGREGKQNWCRHCHKMHSRVLGLKKTIEKLSAKLSGWLEDFKTKVYDGKKDKEEGGES